MKTLVVFTQSYPYVHAGEPSFLGPELAALRARFDRIIIVPRHLPDTDRPLATDLEIDLSLGRRLQAVPGTLIRNGLGAVTAAAFYREVRGNLQHTQRPRGLARAFAFAGMATATAAWARSFLPQVQAASASVVMYTYWMNFITEGLSALRRRGLTAVPLVTRAHGWDLYEERRRPPYIPFRRETIAGVSKLCVISEHGLVYLKKRQPGCSGKVELHRLGVPDTGIVTRPSGDGVWRLLSCSFAVPVKRLDLLHAALTALATRYPAQSIEWTHIGGGPELARLRQLVSREPSNLRSTLTATLEPAAVIEFYASKPIDLFVNVSEAEGLPVSVMESQRAGVPVMATDVGGTREIVTPAVGRLVPPDASAIEIADTIAGLLLDPSTLSNRRKESVANWRDRFDAGRNYAAFADSVALLA